MEVKGNAVVSKGGSEPGSGSLFAEASVPGRFMAFWRWVVVLVLVVGGGLVGVVRRGTNTGGSKVRRWRADRRHGNGVKGKMVVVDGGKGGGGGVTVVVEGGVSGIRESSEVEPTLVQQERPTGQLGPKPLFF